MRLAETLWLGCAPLAFACSLRDLSELESHAGGDVDGLSRSAEQGPSSEPEPFVPPADGNEPCVALDPVPDIWASANPVAWTNADARSALLAAAPSHASGEALDCFVATLSGGIDH